MQAAWKFEIDKPNRTVRGRMMGRFDEEAMRKAVHDVREATASFHGQPHVYLADMRGMKPSHPSVAAILGQAIGWARRNGVVLCAHVSDDAVSRLQAAHIARRSGAAVDVTVDCASYEEAERVVRKAIETLLRDEPMVSVTRLVAGRAVAMQR